VDTKSNPIPSAEIHLFVETTKSYVSNSKTDEQGNYEINTVAVGDEYFIGVRADGYESAKSEKFTATENPIQMKDIILEKSGDGFIAGRITDENGKPLKAELLMSDRVLLITTSMETDAQGYYRIGNLSTPTVDIHIYAIDGRGSIDVTGIPTNRTDINIALDTSEGAKYNRSVFWNFLQMIGKPAPELDIAAWFNSEPITLKQLKGKVVVLHFWTVLSSVPAGNVSLLNELHQKYTDKKLVIIGICGGNRDTEKIPDSIRERQIRYKIAQDQPILDGRIGGKTFSKYDVRRLPTFVLIDQNGIIKGSVYETDLKEKVDALLKK
jgi:peroxiredoxin